MQSRSELKNFTLAIDNLGKADQASLQRFNFVFHAGDIFGVIRQGLLCAFEVFLFVKFNVSNARSIMTLCCTGLNMVSCISG